MSEVINVRNCTRFVQQILHATNVNIYEYIKLVTLIIRKFKIPVNYR